MIGRVCEGVRGSHKAFDVGVGQKALGAVIFVCLRLCVLVRLMIVRIAARRYFVGQICLWWGLKLRGAKASWKGVDFFRYQYLNFKGKHVPAPNDTKFAQSHTILQALRSGYVAVVSF